MLQIKLFVAPLDAVSFVLRFVAFFIIEIKREMLQELQKYSMDYFLFLVFYLFNPVLLLHQFLRIVQPYF